MPKHDHNSSGLEEQVSLTFGCHEQLLPDLVPVGVTEVNDSQRSAAAGVVDDVTDNTLWERRRVSMIQITVIKISLLNR